MNNKWSSLIIGFYNPKKKIRYNSKKRRILQKACLPIPSSSSLLALLSPIPIEKKYYTRTRRKQGFFRCCLLVFGLLPKKSCPAFFASLVVCVRAYFCPAVLLLRGSLLHQFFSFLPRRRRLLLLGNNGVCAIIVKKQEHVSF